MLKLALTIVAIALADCVNPSLIGGELFVATGPNPRRGVLIFTISAGIVTFIFGVALALGVGHLILDLVPKPGHTVKYALITSAGAVLVLGGAVIWLRRKSLATHQPSTEQHGSPALIAAGIAGVELLTAFPYFGAIALIVGSGVSDPARLSLLALYCVVYCLPLIVIAAVLAILGERGERRLRPVGEWLLANWPVVVAPVTALIGAAVLAYGASQLS